MKDKELGNRLTIFLLASLLMLGILLARLYYLQLYLGDKYITIANRNIIRTAYIPAPRGEITDRKGKVLALDVPRLNICAIPAEIDDMNIFCKTLSPHIGYTPDRIRKIIERKGINPYQKIVIKAKVNTDTMMHVAEIQPDLPGLYMEVQPVREYPRKESAAHIIGYVGEITEDELKKHKSGKYLMGSVIGKDGIEKQYDHLLRGEPGEVQVLVDVSGRVIRTIYEKKPRAGYNIALSIDILLQEEIEKALAWHVNSLSVVSREPLAAACVIEDVNTGEILAMASIPQFDPNLFSKGISVKDYEKLINRKDYPLLNRAVSGQYPLASTFKMVTASAALQEGIITRYSPFYCKGYYMVENHRFNCFVRTGHGHIDFNKAMAESCDVAFYFMGEKLGIDRLLKYSREFGLGSKTGIDLPGEIPGLLPDNHWKMSTVGEPWYTGDTVNLSIGQGYLGATPLQLANLTAAVVNGGKVLTPTLVKSASNREGRLIPTGRKKSARKVKVDPGHLSAVLDGMRSATGSGTAVRLKSSLTCGGKTGTAENFPCPENPNGRNHTWFAGFSPSDRPEIAIVIFFERSGGYAGKVAVPLASEALEAYYNIIWSRK